jgi:hypothetical protein
MSEETLAAIALVVGIAAIAVPVVWLRIRAGRRFAAEQPVRVQAWEAVRAKLGLGWVVPMDRTLADARPPALNGTTDGRKLWLGMRDDALDEDTLPKWGIDLEVGLRGGPRKGRALKGVLKGLKQGRRAEAKVVKGKLVVRRSGAWTDAGRLQAFVDEGLSAAAAIEALPLD